MEYQSFPSVCTHVARHDAKVARVLAYKPIEKFAGLKKESLALGVWLHRLVMRPEGRMGIALSFCH